MKSDNKWYYIYSICAVLIIMTVFGFFIYFMYDLIIKLSTNQFANVALISSLITIFITVFIGGWFNKSLELRNSKHIESYKEKKDISLNIISLASAIINNIESEKAKNLLGNENIRAELFLNDIIVQDINNFLESSTKENYNTLLDNIKKELK